MQAETVCHDLNNQRGKLQTVASLLRKFYIKTLKTLLVIMHREIFKNSKTGIYIALYN